MKLREMLIEQRRRSIESKKRKKVRKSGTALRLLTGLLLVVGVGALLSGCTLDRNSVKLHSKEEAQKFAEERYGDAEFVGMEAQEGEKRRVIFTFRDTKYGFTYEVISRPNSVGMDGSTFYYDGAIMEYRYLEPFLQYFAEQEKETFERQGITLSDTVKIGRFEYGERIFSLKDKRLVSTQGRWEEDLKFVWDRVHAYKEIPELTRQYELEVYGSDNGEFIGIKKETEFVTAEALRIEYFMNQARSLGDVQDITYLRSEKKKVSEVPGLSEQSFYEEQVKKNDGTVTVFYFSHEGQEYFIVDAWVAQYGDNGGGIFQFYQNYKYYEPVPDK